MDSQLLPVTSAGVQPPTNTTICGFWRRIAALVIDWVILAIPLEVFGWSFFGKLSQIGDRAAVIGILVAVTYFGILGSSMGNGQTIGMRVCSIKVVDADGRLLTLPRSLVRYSILWIPLALSGAAMPNILVAIVDIALFFIFYLYVFNRRTRQSLHDIAVGSFVIDSATAGQPIQKRMWKVQWAIASACVIAGMAAAAVVTPMLKRIGPFPELLAIQQQIAASGDVHQVGVQASVNWMNGQTSHYLVVTAIWKGRPQDYEKAATKLASIVMRADPNVMQRDLLQINIRSDFNLGLATGGLSRSFSHRPSEWQQLAYRTSMPEALRVSTGSRKVWLS